MADALLRVLRASVVNSRAASQPEEFHHENTKGTKAAVRFSAFVILVPSWLVCALRARRLLLADR
jgi:hypothetical protein